MNWISVKDKLPEHYSEKYCEYDHVIICSRMGFAIANRRNGKWDVINTEGGNWFKDCGLIMDVNILEEEITHWAYVPLPEEPIEKEEEQYKEFQNPLIIDKDGKIIKLPPPRFGIPQTKGE